MRRRAAEGSAMRRGCPRGRENAAAFFSARFSAWAGKAGEETFRALRRGTSCFGNARRSGAREKRRERGGALSGAAPFFFLYMRYMRQAFPALRDGRAAHRSGAGGTRARPVRNASILRRRRAAFAPFCRNFIRRRQGNPESLYGALRFSLQREKRRNARRDGADAGFGGNGPACGAYSVFTK